MRICLPKMHVWYKEAPTGTNVQGGRGTLAAGFDASSRWSASMRLSRMSTEFRAGVASSCSGSGIGGGPALQHITASLLIYTDSVLHTSLSSRAFTRVFAYKSRLRYSRERASQSFEVGLLNFYSFIHSPPFSQLAPARTMRRCELRAAAEAAGGRAAGRLVEENTSFLFSLSLNGYFNFVCRTKLLNASLK